MARQQSARQKKKDRSTCSDLSMRRGGLEPPQPNGHKALNLACLPNSTTYAWLAHGNYATPQGVSTGKSLLSRSNAEATSFLDILDFIEDLVDV